MSDIAIRVENLSKQYTIPHANGRHDTLRDAMAAFGSRLLSGFRKPDTRHLKPDTRHPTPDTCHPTPDTRHPTPSETFWALRDVSFEIKRGEVVGIIGRNGAGKSTLLKILSRITDPTQGRAEIYGRVGSLLEVGTGFHPELTGRENIYLNGAILGMMKEEIKRKFDEIVAFAEVEKFIDMPVKHYSSGMYVRLAFAVAAHLEPEIMIVDEVLAVGDASFQKKCLGKMGSVAKEGRTVLFVTHNMGAIGRLCSRAIWLSHGELVGDGLASDIVGQYQAQFMVSTSEWIRPSAEHLNGQVSFLKAVLKDKAGRITSAFAGNEPITVELRYVVRQPLAAQIGSHIFNSEGLTVFFTSDGDEREASALPREPGYHEATFTIPACFLAPGTYSLDLVAHLPLRHLYEIIDNPVVFEVSPSGSLTSLEGRGGLVTPTLKWETRKDLQAKRHECPNIPIES